MGEVRVMVKMTNVGDLLAAGNGKLAADQVRTITANALVDTGAVLSCVPRPLLDQLGLQPVAHRMVEYTNGQKEAVGVSYGIMFEVLNRQSSDDALAVGDEVLIGQTLLEKMDLLVDSANRMLIPNPAHPDVAVTKLK